MKAWAVTNKRTGAIALRSLVTYSLAIYCRHDVALADCAKGQVPRAVQIKVLPTCAVFSIPRTTRR